MLSVALSLAVYVAIVVAYFLAFADHRANPDFIGYYRNALYWSEGRFSLAISGYWGPLISFMMIPLLALFKEPTEVGWVAAFASGALFIAAAGYFFRVCGFNGKYFFFSIFGTTFFAANWVGGYITPDLLLGALYVLAAGLLLRSYQNRSRVYALLAGAAFGLGYLAKAPGLVFGVGAIASAGLLLWLTREAAADIARLSLAALCGLAAVALPWILVLSLHYGEPTWSSAAARNLAPSTGREVTGRHVYHIPREGRITAWEDPTELENAVTAARIEEEAEAEAAPQKGLVRTVISNFFLVSKAIIAPGWFALVEGSLLALLLHRGRPRFLAAPWRLGGVFAAVVAAPYFLTFIEIRYYVPCFPLLLASAVGLLKWAEEEGLLTWKVLPWIPSPTPAYVALAFFAVFLWMPNLMAALWQIQPNLDSDYRRGGEIAGELRQWGDGAQRLAAVGDLTTRQVGLYTAFHLGAAYYGGERTAAYLDFLLKHNVDTVVSDRKLHHPRFSLLGDGITAGQPARVFYLYRSTP